MTKAKPTTARILVVEDNQADVFLLRHALNEHAEDYQLEVLASDPTPCAIVLDLHLPKHDGAAVLKAIRLEPTLAHIHVVALTSLASPTEELEVRKMGLRLYRSKPTELDGWIQLAREILEICHEGAEVPV